MSDNSKKTRATHYKKKVAKIDPLDEKKIDDFNQSYEYFTDNADEIFSEALLPNLTNEGIQNASAIMNILHSYMHLFNSSATIPDIIKFGQILASSSHDFSNLFIHPSQVMSLSSSLPRLVLEDQSKTFILDGRPLQLSQKKGNTNQFKFLKCLYRKAFWHRISGSNGNSHFVSLADISKSIWPDDVADTRDISKQLNNLRSSLPPEAKNIIIKNRDSYGIDLDKVQI